MYIHKNRETFSFSAENPTGARNGGTRGKDCEKLNSAIPIKSGETVTICDVDGSGKISHMWFTGDICNALILRIYWDNSEYPSVEAPLSAFCGRAYDENFADRDGNFVSLNSALLLIAPAIGMNCYFEMPFKKHCKITVQCRSVKEKWLYYQITGWRGELPENTGYFHATYRQEHPVQKGRGYVVLDNIEGTGRFLGVTMAAGINGVNDCWVEGEVKMYIDGEQYPSLNYTGNEDYFCGSYAFGYDIGPKKYQTYNGLYVGLNAIIGNTDERTYNFQQRFSLYRWHVKDEIYFSKSFKMVMDNYGGRKGPRYDDYTTVAYYYMEKPSPVPFTLPPQGDMYMS